MAATLTPAELLGLVTDLASQPKSFYALAKRLQELQTASPADFGNIITSGVVGYRRAYQLVRIARVFGPSNISVPDLEGAGFTKLNLIAEKHEKAEKAYSLDAHEIEHLLAWATEHTVKALRDRLAKNPNKEKKRVVLIYLSQADYTLFRAAMIKFGAAEKGKGLVDQETALMKLIASLAPAD